MKVGSKKEEENGWIISAVWAHNLCTCLRYPSTPSAGEESNDWCERLTHTDRREPSRSIMRWNPSRRRPSCPSGSTRRSKSEGKSSYDSDYFPPQILYEEAFIATFKTHINQLDFFFFLCSQWDKRRLQDASACFIPGSWCVRFSLPPRGSGRVCGWCTKN